MKSLSDAGLVVVDLLHLSIRICDANTIDLARAGIAIAE